MHHPLLRIGQRKGQVVGIEAIEAVANLSEDIAPILAAVVGSIAEDIELDVEEFLKLQSEACPLGVLHGLGIVDLSQGLIAGDKVQRSRDIGWQRLG